MEVVTGPRLGRVGVMVDIVSTRRVLVGGVPSGVSCGRTGDDVGEDADQRDEQDEQGPIGSSAL